MGVKEVEKAGLWLMLLQFLFKTFRPMLTSLVTKQVTDFVKSRVRHGATHDFPDIAGSFVLKIIGRCSPFQTHVPRQSAPLPQAAPRADDAGISILSSTSINIS